MGKEIFTFDNTKTGKNTFYPYSFGRYRYCKSISI